MSDLPLPLRLAVILTGVAAAGNLLLAVAHTGVRLPLLSAFGPEGGSVPPAVVGFGVAAVVFTVIAIGLHRRSKGAWIGGLVVGALSILSGIGQFRGVVTALAMVVALGIVALLLVPASRRAVEP